MRRRQLLSAAPPLAWALAGCGRGPSVAHLQGGFTSPLPERGHLVRQPPPFPPGGVPLRRVRTLILGGGIAGLAAARALRLRGQDDFALLELDDAPGGNSRGGRLGGMACPLGAHYLPVPGDDAPEVQDLLEDLGLRQRVAGRWIYDERHLCHSPQERLYRQGHWQDGLLPVQGAGPGTLAQYRRFAALVADLGRRARFALPAARAPWLPAHQALDSVTLQVWLDQQGLDDPQLRWYLDYCCRDDYGAGLARVSAWAGIHYFASRHGFHAPGEPNTEQDAVLTWPQGNGWLVERLAAPLGQRLQTGCVVLRVRDERHQVSVDVLRQPGQQPERWQAERAIIALPLHVAARVVENPPEVLRQTAARLPHAPWLVANWQLSRPLRDRPGAAPSWDNVLYGSASLGYVDAMHQSLSPVPGPTVLTHYLALGDVPDARALLLSRTWADWRDPLLAELMLPHPDLPDAAVALALTRHAHAMAIPVPGLQTWLRRLAPATRPGQPMPLPRAGRLSLAHSDWAGYSVFEEAYVRGLSAGQGHG